ncbi:MAG: SDR family NAD(P)-dependent oxidoreductase [Cytophagales bacterium]|nr:SDR family NAD(P)-dependent oxidoreductase [Cytophagales bacterium]
MKFKEKYGPTALILGASEGLGSAFAQLLAAEGLDLILVARRAEVLELTAQEIKGRYPVNIKTMIADLGDMSQVENLKQNLAGTSIQLMVYNAALSHIGSFLSLPKEGHKQIATVNMLAPLSLVHHFGGQMVQTGKGGIILMASMAGLQGSGYLSTYAATKAFDRILAEGLWYEWKSKGVDVMACCAGAISTPNYLNTKPKPLGFMAPKPQDPAEVVKECIQNLGKTPSFISGNGNRWASFFMQKLFPRRMAIETMGKSTEHMYSVG